MTCSLVAIDELARRLGITAGTRNFDNLVAYAYAAKIEFIQRYSLSEEFVVEAIRGAINGSRYHPYNTVRLLFQLAESRANREVIESLLGDFHRGGPIAWGALFVVEFLDITGLWRVVRQLERVERIVTRAGEVIRRYDIVLTSGERFELKNWWMIDDGLWQRSHARIQLIRDLIRGPFVDTFWVFSRGLPVNTETEFYEWFIREGDGVVERWARGEMSDVPGLTSEVADRVRRNWEALKANNAERLRARVTWLSPEEIRNLRNDEEWLSMVERMLIEEGLLSAP